MQSGGTLGVPCLLALLDARAVLLQTCCRMPGCFGPCTQQSQNWGHVSVAPLPSILGCCHRLPVYCGKQLVVKHYSMPERTESAFHGAGLMGWHLNEARAHRRSITFAKSTMLAPKALMS